MKTIYLLLIPLVMISCSEGKPDDVTLQSMAEVQAEDESSDCYDPDDSDCPCFDTDTQVADEGVAFWESAWFQYYGQEEELSETANQLIFSRDSINKLYSCVRNSGVDGLLGMRLYYGLEEGGTIPVLIMVPVDGYCDDMEIYGDYQDSNVLIKTPDSEYFGNLATGANLATNWRNSGAENDEVLTAIYAYNYAWSDIQNLIQGDGDYNSGLVVEFGLRTLSPQEVCFPTTGDGSYGTIIYCNLISSENPDPDKDFGRLDFAMPCPKVCDCNSPLY